MASCRRAGATCAAGSRRASAASILAWIPAIQAWKSASPAFTGIRGPERLQHFALQDPDLLLRSLELLLAEARELQAPLVRGERLLEGELAAFHPRNDFFQLRERFLESGLGCGARHGLAH